MNFSYYGVFFYARWYAKWLVKVRSSPRYGTAYWERSHSRSIFKCLEYNKQLTTLTSSVHRFPLPILNLTIIIWKVLLAARFEHITKPWSDSASSFSFHHTHYNLSIIMHFMLRSWSVHVHDYDRLVFIALPSFPPQKKRVGNYVKLWLMSRSNLNIDDDAFSVPHFDRNAWSLFWITKMRLLLYSIHLMSSSLIS